MIFMMKMEVKFFNGRSEKFFANLELRLRSRVDSALHLLGEYGNDIGLPYSRALGKGLFELRIIGMTHIRFIYTFYNNKVWILHGFIKKTERISKGDIEYARKQLKLLLQ